MGINKSPVIWVITGCMRAGKTNLLLELSKQNKKLGEIKQYFIKPDTDTRHIDCIESRSGLKSFANSFPRFLGIPDMYEYIDTFKKYKMDAVYIDEAQFFGVWIVTFIEELHEAGINVYISGLDKDSNGIPFGYMGDLMCLATYVTKEKAQCPMCDRPGTADITIKRNDNPDVISIGGDDKYTVRCWAHRKEI